MMVCAVLFVDTLQDNESSAAYGKLKIREKLQMASLKREHSDKPRD